MKTTIQTNHTDNSLTFRKLIDNFILAAQFEGKAPRTIEQYERVLLPFANFIKCNAHEVQVSHIRSFLGALSNKGWSKATIWTFYKNLNVFFNFCRREGYLSDNPVRLVSKPRIPKILPRTLTDEEIRALLRAAKDKGFCGRRNVALVALMFDCGLRASEVCNLDVTDVSLENQVVRVFGKGSKGRIVPFSKKTAKLLFSYLKSRGNQTFEDHLFLTKHGNSIDRKFLCKLVKRLAKKAGIEPSKVIDSGTPGYPTAYLQNNLSDPTLFLQNDYSGDVDLINGYGDTIRLRNKSEGTNIASGISVRDGSSNQFGAGIYFNQTGQSDADETFDTTFWTSNSGNSGAGERMRITSDGNVGIGTANPEATLHVAGTTRMSGDRQSIQPETTYVAQTDSFVYGYVILRSSGASNILLWSDAINGQTDLIWRVGKEVDSSPDIWYYVPFMAPIKGGNFFRIGIDSSFEGLIHWMPLGNPTPSVIVP